MRRVVVGALVVLLVAALTPVARSDIRVLSLVRVRPANDAEAAYLMSRFDETHNHDHGEIELLLWPGDRAVLDSLRFDYDVVVEDVVARGRALARGPRPLIKLPGPDRDTYRRLEDYNTEMKELAKENPSLVKLFEMRRRSLEDRTIYGIEIAADVKRLDGRPIFYIDALHHAREWPASEYTMLFAHWLVERFGKDPRLTSLLRKARVIVVPIVNPDGFDYSRESPQSANQTVSDLTWVTAAGNGFEGYWRKNRRSFTEVTVPEVHKNPDAYGVDPNRNYAYLWGDSDGGSSGFQLNQTYRGSAPFSEPETKNVRDIILGRNVTGIITNHTYQGSVLRAGGGQAPEDDILESVGQRLADILGYENRGTVGYPTTGTTDDWAYAAMGALGFTIEHGVIGFHPPYEDEVGAFWKEHMVAFAEMLEVSADASYHSVISGRVAGGAAKLVLTKRFRTELSEGNPTGEDSFPEKLRMQLSTEPDGSFEWHVTPSSRPWEKRDEHYTLTIRAGGKTKTLQVLIDRGNRLDLGTIRL